MKRKILSLTASRSDYSIMKPVFNAISVSPNLQLKLIITGMHFLRKFTQGIKKVKHELVAQFYELNPKQNQDMISFFSFLSVKLPKLIDKIKPDLVLLQGDRIEMLALAISSSLKNIPIIHMSGGDSSGSIDDSIRNAISNFAHLHLTTCSLSSKKLIERGEDKNRIIEVGEPGIDVITEIPTIDKEKLYKKYKLSTNQLFILATQHPVTAQANQSKKQMLQTLKALEQTNLKVIITYPNNDLGYEGILEAINEFNNKPWLKIIPTLGSIDYLNLLRYATVLVGNSSSGIIEAPYFKIPVVNIGDRQFGRFKAVNVIDVPYETKAIYQAIQFVMYNPIFRMKLKKCKSIYGNGKTSVKTVAILENLILNQNLLSKWKPIKQSLIKYEPYTS